MKRLVAVLALLAFSVQAQPTTQLSLTLQFGSFSGPPITNATTVLTDSHGNVVVTMTGPKLLTNLSLPMDIYVATVTAPALNGHPAVNFSFNLPMGTQLPVNITVKSFSARLWVDSTGQQAHGMVAAEF